MAPAPDETEIRNRLLAEHRRLDDLLEQLLAAVRAADHGRIEQLWKDFEGRKRAHLETEDQHLIPVVIRSSERDGRVLLREHQHIRSRLTELAGAVERHEADFATVRAFVNELDAHERCEDRILYRWLG